MVEGVATTELSLIARCGPFVVGLPTASLIKLSLASDVKRANGLVIVDGTAYATWRLDRLLGVDGTQKSIALFGVPVARSQVLLALEFDECLRIESLRAVSRLDRTMFEDRPLACRGAFEVSPPDLVGWAIDVEHLWTRAELEESARRCTGWAERPRSG